MTRYKFNSVFKDEIHKYLDDKQRSGFDSNHFRSNLIGFDRFCDDMGLTEPIFTSHQAALWIEKRKSECHTTHYSRINATKHFLRYLSIKGYDVFPVKDIKYKGTDFVPHIYTTDETQRYFAAVDNCSSRRNKYDAIQYPVLFRIMYCCGTRINETLGIRRKDVDLEKGIILLNEAKNNKQRYVVAGDDLKQLINAYANKCFYRLNDEDYIFVNANGGRLDAKTVYEKHRDFLLQAGIPFLGNNKGPRIHDWRHTMAVYSFKQLTDSGLDMYVALPILSAYLGHKTILATEHYVRLTLQLFPYFEEKFKGMVDGIFGGAAHEDN
jgi:integrase